MMSEIILKFLFFTTQALKWRKKCNNDKVSVIKIDVKHMFAGDGQDNIIIVR